MVAVWLDSGGCGANVGRSGANGASGGRVVVSSLLLQALLARLTLLLLLKESSPVINHGHKNILYVDLIDGGMRMQVLCELQWFPLSWVSRIELQGLGYHC